VLVFEDIHWAEEPLLELIEHLVTWVREAPLLVITLARPELLDIRPGWGGGRVRATSIELEPLGQSESEELVDALITDGELAEHDRRPAGEDRGQPALPRGDRAMLAEEGSAEHRPDPGHAAGADRRAHRPARADAKALLQRAAVIGRIFWEGALGAPLARARVARGHARGPAACASSCSTRSDRRSAASGLQVQARADPRGRLRRALEVGARRPPRRFAEWLKERAGEELLEIRAFHSTGLPRC
jgi:hypothetical protein